MTVRSQFSSGSGLAAAVPCLGPPKDRWTLSRIVTFLCLPAAFVFASQSAAAEVSRSIFFAAAIIIAGFVPLFTLSGIEGSLSHARMRVEEAIGFGMRQMALF